MQTPKRGDPLKIQARDWNDMLQVVSQFRTGEILFDAPDLVSSLRSATTVKLYNATGAPLEQCAIVGLGEPVITPTDNLQEFIRNFTFRSVPPPFGRWGVLQAPCSEDEFAPAVIAGVTACRIHIQSESPMARFASLVGNQLQESYGSGEASILWRQGGAGAQWAIIRIGQLATVHHVFTLLGDMEGGAAEAEIRDMDDAATIESANVYDPVGIFAELSEGARGICVYQLGRYYIIQAECE